MNSRYKVVAEHEVEQNNWAVKIVPPGYLQGRTFVQDGIWYYASRFNSQKEAYSFAKARLRAVGFTEDEIENGVEYQ